jgi:hypothetical protein
MLFDSYKTFMRGAAYMQNRHVREGRLFANFPAMLARHTLYGKLRETGLPGKYSPKGMIGTGGVQTDDRGSLASGRSCH